ncbi:MAG: hypothetical protein DDT19_00653 [Syntrophomonadaceae bacterium]|nr:hypothetical protein [Bacillota bacterium]
MLDEKLLAENLTGLCELFERKKNKVLQDTYYEALKHLTHEEFLSAVSHIIQTKKFHKLPLPAEFIEAAKGDIESKALLALQKVEDAIRRHGYVKSLVFDDALIHMIINAFEGWENVCSYPYDEWKFKRQEFLKLYKAYALSPVEYPNKLIGYTERTNIFNGFYEHIPSPVLIGNKEQAGLILNNGKAVALPAPAPKVNTLVKNLLKPTEMKNFRKTLDRN